MLCCIFNYAPHYRESIYRKIDDNFDTQFYFGREVIEGHQAGIRKIDYSLFKRRPIEIKNNLILGKILWRTGIIFLPFYKKYSSFLVTGDISWSYFPFLFFCKLLHKKVYGWGHGIKNLQGKYSILTKKFFSSLDGFFIYGELGKKRMIDLGFSASKYHVIYNSLTDFVDKEIQKSYISDILYKHFRNSNRILLFIGRLTLVKQLDWLIKALYELKCLGEEYNLLLIGDGPEKENLRNLAKKLGVYDNVWFYGECYDKKELNTLIYNSDLCVSPGNIGLTAMHALEYGVPVISHNCFELQMPEYEVIVPEKTGMLYQYGDFQDFIKQIQRWFKLGLQRDLVREMCYEIINTHYNSNYQLLVLKQVLARSK